MSKKYYFHFGLSKYEFLNSIMCHRKGEKVGEMIIKTKDSKIFVQNRIHMRHALQRIFVGKLVSDNDATCHIEGKFRYPYFNSFLFIAFGAICFIGNIKMQLSSIYPKLPITLMFSVAYTFVFLMFYTGKRLYKQQENAVLHMLHYLEEKQGDGSNR